MKKLNILSLLFFAAVSITACKKNDTVDPQPQTGNYLTAKKGSAEWVAKFQETNNYKDSTYFFGRVGEENLIFRIKFNGKGKYILTGSQSQYAQTLGGDVTVSEYHADPDAESVLNITGYDADTKTYTGNFNLNLKLNYRYYLSYNAYPTSLAFTNGKFRITLAK